MAAAAAEGGKKSAEGAAEDVSAKEIAEKRRREEEKRGVVGINVAEMTTTSTMISGRPMNSEPNSDYHPSSPDEQIWRLVKRWRGGGRGGVAARDGGR